MRLMIMGVLFIVGGLSGSFVLKGTNSGGALALVGGVLLVIGIVSLSGAQSAGGATQDELEHDRAEDQWAEYQRAKQAAAAKQKQAAKVETLTKLVEATPGADAEIAQLLEKTKDHLDPRQQLALAIETAQRLNAAHVAAGNASRPG